MATRSVTDSPDPAGAPARSAPASALELVGAGAGEHAPTDPEAARQALEAGESARQGDDQDEGNAGAPSSARADRRRRAGDRRPRKGGHKATKGELERELKDLRARADATAPETVAAVEGQAAQLAPALGALFQTAFTMLARQRGEHWKLREDDKQMLAMHWSVCLAPYMSQAGPYVPWVAAVMVTWGVVEGRVELDHKRALPVAA